MQDKIDKSINIKDEFIIEYYCHVSDKLKQEPIKAYDIDRAKRKFRKYHPIDEIKSIIKKEHDEQEKSYAENAEDAQRCTEFAALLTIFSQCFPCILRASPCTSYV